MDNKKIARELVRVARELTAKANEKMLSEVNIKITDGKCEANLSYLVTDGITGKSEKLKLKDNDLAGVFDKILKLEKANSKKASSINWHRVKRYMENNAEDYSDGTGAINMTELAEDAASQFDLDEELDNEDSRIWGIAIEVADEYEKNFN